MTDQNSRVSHSDIEEAVVVTQEEPMKLVPTPASQPASCGHCRYLHQTEVTQNLQRTYECHRFPPQVQAVNMNGQLMMVGQFPPVQLSYWCGEYTA